MNESIIKYLNEEEFKAKLNTCIRFYDAEKEIGMARNQTDQDFISDCKFIFLRDDGWSIASNNFKKTFKLWPKTWANIYLLETATVKITDTDLKHW